MAGRRRTDFDLPPRMYRKCGTYYYVAAQGTKRLWINLGKDLNAAKRQWAELSSKEPSGGMGGLIDRYMSEVAPKKAPRTYKDNLSECENLRKVFSQMECRDVKPMHVAKYLDMRGETAPVRANREKALLSHMFTMGMRWGAVDFNPCKGVHRNREVKRDRYITDEEFSSVWNRANPTIQCLMDVAYLTAQRIGDLVDIRRSDIQEDGIYFQQNKTGKKLLVGMNPSLQAVLERVYQLHPRMKSSYLFSNRQGKQYTYSGLISMFKRAVSIAKVTDFHFHDIRAKALTDASRAGMNAQKLAGHSTEAMTAHYVKRRQVEEVAPLSNIIGK